MKLAPILLLAIVAGGLAFVLINPKTRGWVFGTGGEGVFLAQGYKKAASPKEAMDSYLKAVLNRQYSAAARYCSADYAAQLVRAHDAAKSMGGYLDDIRRLIKDKGYRTQQSDTLLNGFDPFPPFLRVLDVKSGNTASGRFALDGDVVRPDTTIGSDLDKRMMEPHLAPVGIYAGAVYEVKKEGEHWRIQFPLPAAQVASINYFMEHYKSYVEGLREFKDDMNRGRYLKDQVAGELTKILRASR